MIIIEYDYYHFLKSTSRLSAFEKEINTQGDRSYHVLVPENVKNPIFSFPNVNYYSLSQNIDHTPIDFSKTALSLLKYIEQEHITQITFFTFPLIWLYLQPELTNHQIKISKHQPNDFLPKKLTTNLLPFFYQHSLEFFKNSKWTKKNDFFFEMDTQEKEQSSSFIALKDAKPISDFKIENKAIAKNTDVLILNDGEILPLPLSSLKNQDISLYLYRPLLIKKIFFSFEESSKSLERRRIKSSSEATKERTIIFK